MEERPEKSSNTYRIVEKALAFDPERYRQHMAHLNMSEEAQLELLAIVYRIMESFVDRAFGDDATQLARIAGDNLETLRDRAIPAGISSGNPTHIDDETLADVFRLCGEGDSKERLRLHE